MFHSSCASAGSSSPTLADNNSKVRRYLDNLPARAEKLLETAMEEKWADVQRMSEYLVSSSQAYGQLQITQCAQAVCDELAKPENRLAVKRSIMQLVSACNRSRESMRTALLTASV